MNSRSLGLRIASGCAAGIFLLHAVRLITDTSIRIGTFETKPWMSAVAAAIAALLSVWFWRLGSLQVDPSTDR